jgi:hypothetical protein
LGARHFDLVCLTSHNRISHLVKDLSMSMPTDQTVYAEHENLLSQLADALERPPFDPKTGNTPGANEQYLYALKRQKSFIRRIVKALLPTIRQIETEESVPTYYDNWHFDATGKPRLCRWVRCAFCKPQRGGPDDPLLTVEKRFIHHEAVPWREDKSDKADGEA